MRLKKNVNMNSIVGRLEQLQQEAGVLIKAFKDAIQLFDNNKLGISELDYKIDEDVMRFNNTHDKIQELIRNL